MVIVIAEDERHRMLVYRYLRRRGLSSHEIRTKISPSGQGSAEQWIRTNFEAEVRAYRIRHARAASALIVMIDADTQTVEERLRQLGQALRDGGSPQIDNRDQIARLVPKRNVETWILCLTAHTVDEETDYKRTRHDWHELIPPASAKLSQWAGVNATLPQEYVDSLCQGVNELKKLEF